MHIPKEVDYGIQMILILAKGPISSKDIAERYKIPHNFVQLLLPKFVRKGFIEWVPKTKNIYQLTTPPEKISFLDITETVAGPLDLLGPIPSGNKDRDQLFAGMYDAWQVLEKDVRKYLADLTVAQVMK